MIFVTIGTQEPFDRLIKAVDEIAPLAEQQIFLVQASLNTYEPQNFKTVDFMDPTEFELQFNKADLIVGHAGMGTIISALEKRKPIVVMPRLLKYAEHRNEHQLATVRKLKTLGYIHIANDENDLQRILLDSFKHGLKPLHQVGKYASSSLLESLKQFMDS